MPLKRVTYTQRECQRLAAPSLFQKHVLRAEEISPMLSGFHSRFTEDTEIETFHEILRRVGHHV